MIIKSLLHASFYILACSRDSTRSTFDKNFRVHHGDNFYLLIKLTLLIACLSLFMMMRMRIHVSFQNGIYSGLITATLILEVLNNVFIEPQ